MTRLIRISAAACGHHDERLIVDWHEIGEPLRIKTWLMFEDNQVLAMVTHLPMGRISHLEGTMAE